MLFRVKPMVHGLALAFGGLAVVGTTAYAQTPPAQQQQLERITITGSNIRRTDQETVAPVEIITREQIERTGPADRGRRAQDDSGQHGRQLRRKLLQ